MNKKNILILTSTLIILSLGVFMFLKDTNSKDSFINNPQVKNIVTSAEEKPLKFFTNEITGEKIYSEVEPEFLKNRPLAVMVNNAIPARPQVGLGDADIIYEIIAEGGITRFLAVYHSTLPEMVGPIRSTREYYLTVVKELGDAMLMHIGFSPQARVKIDEWQIRSLGLSGAPFYRNNFGDSNIATEHTAYSSGKELFKKGLELGWSGRRNFDLWRFKDEKEKTQNLKKANYVEINFWYKGDYSGIFKYNPSNNKYTRYSGFDDNDNPILLLDRVSKKEIEVSNLIVMFADEVPIPNDDKNRLDYKLIGEGSGFIFRDGTVDEVIWKKESIEKRTKFYLVNGEEVEFNRGKIWVSVVPSRNTNQVIIK